MAVSREVYNLHRPVQQVADGKARQLAYLVTGLLALLAIYVIMSHVVAWGRIKVDDVRYGRPRTFHLQTNVVSGDQHSVPTHFIAMNLDRQVIVFEIPGQDVTQIRTLSGPYLFGAGEDLTPVTLRMEDVNRDSASDLVLQVKDEEVMYIYRDGGFSLITPEERQMLGESR